MKYPLFMILVAFCARSLAAQVPSQWISIELSTEMHQHLVPLAEDEKKEQCRDWIKYAFINALKLNDKMVFEVLYDFNPLRYDYLNELSNFEYGESRFFYLNSGDLYVFVPHQTLQRRNLIAKAFDEYRTLKGIAPIKTHLIDYELNTQNFLLKYCYLSALEPAHLLNEAYGYFEMTVKNQTDLKQFIDKTDDVVLSEMKENGVLLGGRKYENCNTKKVTIEDLTVLYQADTHIKEDYIKKLDKRGLTDKYKNHKAYIETFLEGKTIGSVLKANEAKLTQIERLSATIKNPILAKKIKELKIEIEILKSAASYNHFVDFFKNNLVVSKDSLNIGFSLDPQTKYLALADALQHIIRGDSFFIRTWYNEHIKENDKKTFILSFKNKQEKIKQEKFLYLSQDDITTHETSLNSFIFGNETIRNNKFNIYDYWLTDSTISREKIDALLEAEMAEIHLLGQEYKPILMQLIGQIQQEKEDSKKLGLYYELVGFLENRTLINIGIFQAETEDPDEKIVNSFATDLIIQLLKQNDYLHTPEVNYNETVAEAVRTFQKEVVLPETGIVDNQTYIQLLNTAPFLKQKLQSLQQLLANLIHSYQYQKGRYDGYLQGTEVGMTLFYTDLVMKLWSFDYQNTVPQKFISGFQPQTNYPISVVYERDMQLNSSTRSWLGTLQESFNFYKDGNLLLWNHCATQIYNASPNDLFPGVESKANKSSERFANWWNHHYSEIAHFEPEYHRLNQIMKWTTIVYWLKIKNQSLGFDHQKQVRTRHLDFEQWYHQNTTLKTKPKIPFLNKNSLNETTECIDMIHSEPFFPFYNNDESIYHFLGGVSLGKKWVVNEKMKSPKKRVILQSGFDRKNWDTKLSENREAKIVTHDKSTYQLDISNKKCKIVLESSEKEPITIAKAKDAQVFNLTVERTLNDQQIIQYSGDKHLGTVSAVKQNEIVQLSMRESDISKVTKFVQSVENQYLPSAIMRHSDVEYAFSIQHKQLVKLKGVDSWIELKLTEVPVKPNEQALYAALDLRFAFKDFFNPKKYLDVSYKKFTEVEALFKAYPWQKMNHHALVELTELPPASFDTKLFFKKGAITTEVIEYQGVFYLKNDDWVNTLPISNVLNEAKTTISAQLTNNKKFAGLVFNHQKEPFVFSNQSLTAEYVKDFENIFSEQPLKIKGIIASEDAQKVQFLGENVLSIPLKWTSEQKEVVSFINKKVNKKNQWVAIFKNESIEIDDIKNLALIDDVSNFNLCKNYYPFKQVDNLKPENVLIDFTSNSQQPQILVKKRGQHPYVITMKQQYPKTISETSAEIEVMYQQDAKNYTFEEMKTIFQPIADLQKEVMHEVGDFSKVITKETKGVNFEVVNKLFNEDSKFQFIKDQPNIKETVQKIQTPILVHHDASIVLTTMDLQDEYFSKLKSTYEAIEASNVTIKTGITAADFRAMMVDDMKQQIFLLVRCTKNGLIFSDRVMPFQEIKNWEVSDFKKEMIYIISNETDTLEHLFADSGLFSYVITNRYKIGNLESFHFALENLKNYFDAYLIDNLEMKPKTYQKMLKKYPNLGNTLEGKIKEEPKKVTIEIGKLSEPAYQSLPQQIKDLVNKKLGNKQIYQPKNISDLIHQCQKEQIRTLKLKPQPNMQLRLKGILQFKAYIYQTKNNTNC